VATKKQRRRRQKERRHEYEFVYVDEEGREVEVDDDDSEPTAAKGKSVKQAPAQGRGGRSVDPPSWRRSLRRAAIFAPFMLIVLYLLRPGGSNAATVLLNVLVLMAFFIPFSYFMDSLMYRLARRRAGQGRSPKSKPGR
jgi:hypothetical protein